MIIISRHTFNFEGGELLTTLSASWFISYMYYKKIDGNHFNWKKYPERILIFNNSIRYHRKWLEYVVKMNELQLDKNKIGLTGNEVKIMANKLLKIEEAESVWD